jgi:hypothetical protein
MSDTEFHIINMARQARAINSHYPFLVEVVLQQNQNSKSRTEMHGTWNPSNAGFARMKVKGGPGGRLPLMTSTPDLTARTLESLEGYLQELESDKLSSELNVLRKDLDNQQRIWAELKISE